jgi:hypothetical protein
MALKKSVQTPQGFSAVDAYHRVEGVQIHTKSTMTFMLRSYKDNSDLPAFEDRAYSATYNIDGTNPIAQAYSHLKSLPEFAVAVDC